MENSYKKLMKFNGDHAKLVGLRILNNILKVLTLGLYYPWARASVLQYMYNESEFMGSRFMFHGTGKEMFKGFIKVVAVLILLYALMFACILSGQTILLVVGFIIVYATILLFIPLAIHGFYRYRTSRSSWRGIHFGYRGVLSEFVKIFLLEGLLTMLTFGLYAPWFQVRIKKYTYSHIRFGNIQFHFTGRGLDLFIIRLKGLIFSILTLGIYLFWYMQNLVEFELSNIKMTQNGKEINLRSTLSAGKIFEMIFVNYLIIIFTFGIGTGIAINRAMRTAFENMEFDGEIDPDSLLQTEGEYKDAVGDDMASVLDIPLF